MFATHPLEQQNVNNLLVIAPLFLHSFIEKYLNQLLDYKESIIANQIGRSGTSIGANIREAQYAHGKADFIAKLQIALKECSESEYWLELLIESGYYGDKSILDRCIEIKKILISSINTSKNGT